MGTGINALGQQPNMTLRQLFVCVSLLALCLTVALGLLWQRNTVLTDQKTEAAGAVGQAIVLAEELRTSTERMSTATRRYVQSGETYYVDLFTEQRTERDGVVSMVLNHSAQPGLQQQRLDIPFQNRIRDADIRPEERELIALSWANALAIADAEAEAIRARQGHFTESVTGRFVTQPDQAVARRLLSDPELELRRIEILELTDEFLELVTARRDQVLADFDSRIGTNVTMMAMTFIALLGSVLAVVGFVWLNILSAFDKLRFALVAFAHDERRQPVVGTERRDEVGEMARAVVTLQDRSLARLDQLQHLAYHDPLTKLANRSYFSKKIEELFENGADRPIAALMIDLDKFKEVNDVHGHPAGDELLKTVAARLQELTSEQDVVARLGGDEFAILALDRAPDEISALSARIVARLAEPIRIAESVWVRSGGTVGYAIREDASQTSSLIVSRADVALYSAKEYRRGTVRGYEPNLDHDMRARNALEQDLRTALEDGQISLFYQPQVSLTSGEISGYEALMRWTHPERGPVSPLEFIPVAEDSRQILPLGHWSINEVCRQLKSWPDDIGVAVNLTGAQLFDVDLADTVRAAVTQHGVSPHRLSFEITEHALLKDHARSAKTLSELKEIGVAIVLDDFGTGYSSLSNVKNFPFDRLKIDPVFVRDLASNRSARAVVQSVIILAKNLGIRITAEGVETEDERNILAEFGCDTIQGYLTGHPKSAELVRRQLTTRTKDTAREFDLDATADSAPERKPTADGSAA